MKVKAAVVNGCVFVCRTQRLKYIKHTNVCDWCWCTIVYAVVCVCVIYMYFHDCDMNQCVTEYMSGVSLCRG